jgi:hypothetical protein
MIRAVAASTAARAAARIFQVIERTEDQTAKATLAVLALRCGRQTVALEDITDRLIADLVPQIGQRPHDPVITPVPTENSKRCPMCSCTKSLAPAGSERPWFEMRSADRS